MSFKKSISLTFLLVFLWTHSAYLQCSFDIPNNYGLICTQAQYLCGYELDGYIGTLSSDLSPDPQPDPVCNGAGTPENTQWFSFLVEDSDVQIEISYTNCSNIDPTLGPGFTTGLYSNCSWMEAIDPDIDLDCATVFGPSSSVILHPDPLEVEVGNLMYFFVDGISGNVCDFSIRVISGVCTDPPAIATTCEQDCGVSNSFSDYVGCTNKTETYTFDPSILFLQNSTCGQSFSNADLDSLICVDWEIIPSTGFTVSGTTQYYDSLDISASLMVDWDEPGQYTIRPIVYFNPLFSACTPTCECTDDVVYTVDIAEGTTTEDTIYLCPNDSYNFCGTTYNTSANVECFDRNTCLTEKLSIIANPISFIDIGDYFICEEHCFEFNGVDYCTANLFSVPHETACDTSYIFELIELDLVPTIVVKDTLIDCENTIAIVEATWTTNYTGNIIAGWYDSTDQMVSSGEILNTSQEGLYTFRVIPEGLESCVIEINQLIIRDDSSPMITPTPPSLDCSMTSGIIQLSSSVNLASASWIGPDGYMSTDINPTVSEEGMYEAVVIADNGCQTMVMVDVNVDDSKPVVEVSYADLDCTEENFVASYTSSDIIIDQTWLSPSGATSSSDMFAIDQEGEYTLMVISDNGCTEEYFFTVENQVYDPSQNLVSEVFLTCAEENYAVNIIMPDSLIGSIIDLSDNTEMAFENGDNFIFENEGQWVFSYTDETHGCVGYDTLTLTRESDLMLDWDYMVLEPDCINNDGGVLSIIDISGGLAPYTYIYQGEEYSQLEDILFESGEQSLTVIDNKSCSTETLVDIPGGNNLEIITEPEVEISTKEQVVLSVDSNLDFSEIEQIIWTDQQGNVLGNDRELIAPLEGGILTVTLIDSFGCEVSTEVLVTLSFEVDIYYPSVFSPNGDGNNDVFYIYNSGDIEMIDKINIYDRAGNLVFEKAGMPFSEADSGWNGMFNNQYVENGVYVFMVRYTLLNGEQRLTSGSITVLR